MDKNLFGKHYKRLVTEGAVKSVLCGLAVGFGVNFVTALLGWFFGIGILLAVVTGILAAAGSGALFYFFRFRPTETDVARRIDALGLEERTVSMLEFRADTSTVARLQREDAQRHLQEVEDRKIALRIPRGIAILTAVALVMGCGMTTVAGLAASNLLPSGSDLVAPEDPLADYIAVSYVVDEGGEIIGEADQLLLPGESTTPVVAVAEEGWMFVGWDDGREDAERHEENVTEAMIFVAIFEEVGEGLDSGAGDGSDGPDEGSEGDSAADAPSEGNNAGENGEAGEADQESGGDGSDGESDGDKRPNDQENDGGEQGEGGQGSSGKWNDSNQFLDGNTYYRDYLDMYYEMAQEIFAEDGSIPPELLEFFEKYYDSI